MKQPIRQNYKALYKGASYKLFSSAVLLMFGLLAGCATSNGGASSDVLGQALPQDRAKLVVLRQAAAIDGPAILVFINGDYHTSLLPGQHKAAVLCPGRPRVAVQFIDGTAIVPDKAAGYPVELAPGQTIYLSIVPDSAGKPRVQWQPTAAPQESLGTVQNQIVSRVHDRACAKPSPSR